MTTDAKIKTIDKRTDKLWAKVEKDGVGTKGSAKAMDMIAKLAIKRIELIIGGHNEKTNS